MRLAFIKNGGGFRKKFFLPLVYLIWMQLILLSKLTCGLLFSDCFNSYLGLVSSTKSATFVFHFLDKLIINYLLSNKTRPVHSFIWDIYAMNCCDASDICMLAAR